MVLPILTWDLTLAASAATISNYDLEMVVTYQGGGRPNSAVGEAQPDAPSPSDPDLAAGPEVSTEFLFSLSCGLGVCTGQDTPQVTWDFGDGTRRVGGMLEGHRYKKPGIYTARASATKGTWHGEVMRTVFVSPRWADVINVRGYDEVVSNDSPVLYWRLGETSSLEAALDRSGNGNSGTYGGDPVMGIAGAIASGENTAVRLGDGDSVTATSPLSFSGNPSLTVEGWVRPEGSVSGDQEVLQLSSVEADGALTWYRTAGGLRVEIGPDSVTVPLLEDWNHVMVGWTAGTIGQVFVNGALAGSIHGGALDLDGGFAVRGGFTGSLDEVAVFDGPLGAARAAAHAAAGADDRIAEARSDRESLWVAGSLGLYDSCRTATRDDGADGLEIGRPMYCPEPRPTTALSAHLTANGPIVVPQQLNSSAALVTAHGVTGEDCLSWWGACNLPKQFFDGPTLETTETVDVAGLEAAGKITGSGELIYDPLNCGDGWAMRRNVGGAFELVRGSEDGCVTKAAWYESLVRAVDGHLAKRPGSTTTRLAAVASTCQDDAPGMAGSTYSMRRAVSLGLIDTDQAERPDHLGTQNGPGFYCDPSSAISKVEAYRSLAWALGVVDDGGCPEGLRDLYDMSLGQDEVRSESPDCALFAGGQERGVPYVGDLVCHWGGEGEGICLNGGDPLFRAAAATLVSGVITEEGRGTGELVLDLSQDGPKPVGTILTVTAVGRAPLTTFGDFTFSFPAGPPGTNRLCGGGLGVVVVPTAEVSGERRATATCGYIFSAEEETSLQVTLTDINANVASSSITVSGVNEAPLAPSPSAMATVGEGALSEAVTTFTSTDLNGQAVTFEISRNELNPFSGPTGPSGPYAGAIAADSPLGFWRLAETSGGVLDNSGNGYNGSATGGVTRNQGGALVGDLSTSYQFDGTGAVEIPGVPAAVGGKTTVELWVRWDGGGEDQVLAAWEGGQWLGFFDGFLGIADGSAFEAAGEGLVRGTPVEGMVGRWNHVVAEFDPVLGESGLYLNGVRQNLEPVLHRVYEGTTSSGTGGPGLVLGSAPAGGSGFSGRIDEVAVYHGTLNSTRMRIHHELGRRRVVAADADGRDMVTLELTALTSNTARVTARPLTGDVNGTYSFLIRSYDGEKWSEATEVEGVINAANDAPVVAAGVISNTGYEGGPDVYPVLYGADPGDRGWAAYAGGVTHYRITAGPESGELYYDSDAGAGTTWTLYEGGAVDTNNQTLRYSPAPGPYGDGYWGVTYQTLDGGYPTPALWSVAREAQIFIASTNDPPVCLPVLAGTEEGEAVEIFFLCSDPDDDTLSYEIVEGPAVGELSGEGASRTYTPAPYWCGDTSYTYRAFDGELYSSTATVDIAVECTNVAPTAPTGNIPAFNEDTSKTATFSTTDADGGPNWTFEVSLNGSTGWSEGPIAGTTTGGSPSGSFTIDVDQGSLTDKQASVTITPAPNICGTFTFYIRASDTRLYSGATEVSGTITCVNDAPTAPLPGQMTGVLGASSVSGTFTTTDFDGGPNWTFEVSADGATGWSTTSISGIPVSIGGSGTVSITQGSLTDKTASITFTRSSPRSPLCVTSTFYVRVSDGTSYSPVRQVFVTFGTTC